MNYLIVSCTTFDGGGLAMIHGAINGISTLDTHAHFRTLHRPEHEKEGCGIQWYREPDQNDTAFQWADVILDIGGLCNNQPNKYEWMRLRKKYSKPYVWMAQSFLNVDKKLLEGTYVVARGERAAKKVRQAGGKVHSLGADLSFLVEDDLMIVPESVRRVFTTHFPKHWQKMLGTCNGETDIQIVTKPYRNRVWEPELPIAQFHGTPEQAFGYAAWAEEVHTCRYQMACAAIKYMTPLTIYHTGDGGYDEKYEDLLDLMGKSRDKLIDFAMASCRIAVEAGK
jgi:hypothetical protein